MRTMPAQRSANDIRREFVDFFKGREHTFVPSSPVVPRDDPTLLFANAGMNQFKTIFLGENRDGLKRAANSQKCMRVSGKHNDLEEVGVDHHHHTFFEMLGNWSFGDYYKKEAVEWAWELLTDVWQLPKERLYATVFEEDNEAMELWRKCTDIAQENISSHGAGDNFWEMGDTGPCGPCSEIHLDTGPGNCPGEGRPDHTCGVNVDGCSRYIELWNLVFIQYDRGKDGSLSDLPSRHVDTGMGFERLVRFLQGKDSDYDTDLFSPIIREIEKLSGKRYAPGPEGAPFRVVADHVRALTFAITDGVFPSNEGRGYVLRRLLRRAYRFGRLLDFSGPFIHKLVPVVVDIMGEAFPETVERREYVVQVIESEEERFDQTLEQGIERFGRIVDACRASGKSRLPGEEVFALYDTFGFPMDLTSLMAAEQDLTVDEDGFERLMEEQRTRARDAAKTGGEVGLSAEGWVELQASAGTEFVGYDNDQARSTACKYKVLEPKGEAESLEICLLVLDKTPFYAESGGQVGDTGTITTEGGVELRVEDTFTWNDMIVHRLRSCSGPVPVSAFSGQLLSRADGPGRMHTRRNHSATHLLQAALRKVVGGHVQQSGSRVAPEGLRFDFSHFAALSQEEIREVENLVNEWALADLPVFTEIKSPDEARKEGATALFGEKYGDKVRVVSMGGISKELCGGTHVVSTGRIGMFHIISESSIAAGIRRIEAVTGMGSVEHLAQKEGIVTRLVGTLKVSEDAVVARMDALLAKCRSLETEIDRLSQAEATQEVDAVIAEADGSGGAFPWVVKNLGSVSKQAFNRMADGVSDAIRSRNLDALVMLLGGVDNGGVHLAACAGKRAVKEFGVHCGDLVKAVAQRVDGGGGGSPVRARAGGKNPAGMQVALDLARELIGRKAGAV